jgi:hypothetical protein
MRTGYRGTFVISWAQTEVDGLQPAPLDVLNVGVSWRWTGTATRVDGPQGVLLLTGDAEGADIRRHAARAVRRLVGAAIENRPFDPRQGLAEMEFDEMPDQGFVLTDGRRSYVATLIEAQQRGVRLVMFVGEMPEEGAELWVVRTAIAAGSPFEDNPLAGGVICFSTGTSIATPEGPRRIETLGAGDRILTKDDGAQEILWTGHRRMTGARLYAMPHLRPIRLRAGALGIDRPDSDLLVSPQHRMLVKGAAARALFNEPEVLVAAKDLVNDRMIGVDAALKEVTYVHLLLPRHEVIWANGLETESFHPSNTSLETVNPVQRAELLSIVPGIDRDPERYGSFARRNLTASEAAILRHDAA